MKQDRSLYSSFQPDSYVLEVSDTGSRVEILGKKTGRPSHRITLHQKGLKVIDAKIVPLDKKNGSEITIRRINHLPSFQQVRIHTQQILYPGSYRVILNFIHKSGATLKEEENRNTLPSIDEPKAWEQAELKIKR